jgi:hypothetical protein
MGCYKRIRSILFYRLFSPEAPERDISTVFIVRIDVLAKARARFCSFFGKPLDFLEYFTALPA